MTKGTLVCDTEVYVDYFAVGLLSVETGKITYLEMWPERSYDEHGLLEAPEPARPFDKARMTAALRHYRIVTFNGINFDIPLITLAMQGADCATIKEAADKIIKNNMKYWAMGIEPVACNHVDLIEVAPGIASLKIYGGRMHAPKMQDLPIEPDAHIEPAQRPILLRYLDNDLHTTAGLLVKLTPQIELREQMSVDYGQDLRSKSDAQIAEAVIRREVEKMTGQVLKKEDPFRLAGDTFTYAPPSFIQFDAGGAAAKALEVVRQASFLIGSNGVVVMPKEVANLKTRIGAGVYRMGIGGLHSSEKSVAHHADAHHILVDRDVASYYPSIILQCGLQPERMGEAFSTVYRGIVKRRLEAKAAHDTVVADALKITINGSFGKFGSPYSVLYSPRLLIQTTVTGQLALLMLIEWLEAEDIPVVSANTDGVVIKCPRDKADVMDILVWAWEDITGFTTEATEYLSIYSRDVNNYVAIKPDGLKVKGVYAPPGLSKNPVNQIVSTAVIKYLQTGEDVADTIAQCKDITKFVTIRTVKGGAMKGDEYLGKAVRWYYRKGETGTINYRLNGYLVPRSEGAAPLMELPTTFPDDVDLDWYVREAREMLADIGAPEDLT